MGTDLNTDIYRSALGVALVTACILLLPAVAMQFSDEVNWSMADFLVAGALLFSTGLAYRILARRLDTMSYRLAVGMALAAALLLVWVNLAVGIIGDSGNMANLMYIGVLAVGITGSFIVRFQPGGMARTLCATAITQALVMVIALVARLGMPENGPGDLLVGNGIFVVLFSGSAWLFYRAAKTRAEPVH